MQPKRDYRKFDNKVCLKTSVGKTQELNWEDRQQVMQRKLTFILHAHMHMAP